MSRPNILLFVTDDHPGWAVGYAGNDEVRTPSIDHIAREGICFTNATTPCPVCSPARASLWTGTIPSWHGVHDHLNSRGHPGIGTQATLATAAQATGYRTAQIGKWHCHTSELNAPKPGFDRWFSHYGGTNSRFGQQSFWDQNERRDFYGYQAPAITDTAIDFIRTAVRDEQPFFCAVGYTDTHRPYIDAPQRIADTYERCPFESIPYEEPLPTHGTAVNRLSRNEPEFAESLKQFYASVSMIDEQVGRVLDCLENVQTRSNTLVIYTADHGQCMGHHGLAGKGNATVPQNFLQESLDVPLIASFPEAIQPARRDHDPVDHLDTFVTILEVMTGEVPDTAPRPGQSWYSRAHTDGVPPAPREYVFAEYGNARMVSKDRIKLVRRYPGPNGTFADELYNLSEDPRETRNVIENPRYLSLLRELDTELEQHFARYSRAECDGRDIGRLPFHNNKEPWRVQV